MKAIVIRKFGPPNVMQIEEVPTPEPGPGEVLIKLHAVSVNRTLDLVARAGRYARPIALPHVLGVDPSGVIAAVGPGVTERKVGDRVVSANRVSEATPTMPPRLLGISVWGASNNEGIARWRFTFDGNWLKRVCGLAVDHHEAVSTGCS